MVLIICCNMLQCDNFFFIQILTGCNGFFCINFCHGLFCINCANGLLCISFFNVSLLWFVVVKFVLLWFDRGKEKLNSFLSVFCFLHLLNTFYYFLFNLIQVKITVYTPFLTSSFHALRRCAPCLWFFHSTPTASGGKLPFLPHPPKSSQKSSIPTNTIAADPVFKMAITLHPVFGRCLPDQQTP